MVHNGILMQTIGISVMVSIGLLLFLLAGKSGILLINQIYYAHVNGWAQNIKRKHKVSCYLPRRKTKKTLNVA